MDNPAFWEGLIKIIGVNIVLSGDNAVVIALAARSLPPKQQKQAVLFGSGAAIVMRVILTIFAASLLAYPSLKLIGSALLLWIAVKLLLPEDESGDGAGHATNNMFNAIKTILIADLVMSLDNVIAVAAAADGDVVLLIIGLAISIPLVIFGSTLILKVMDRFPIVIDIGAGLLGWVSGEMAVTDPLVAEWVNANAHFLHTAAPIAGAAFVIGLGKWLGGRMRREQEAKAVDLALEEGQSPRSGASS